METGNEKYDRLIRWMRNQEPVPEDTESIADRVMEEIRMRKEPRPWVTLFLHLFGWADIGWSRNILTLGASLIIVLFLFQHISLFQKVQRLEDRLIRSSYHYYQSPYPASQTLLRLVSPGDLQLTDSVKISRQDLLNFLQSYQDMEVSYDKLKASLQEELRKQQRRDNPGGKNSKNTAL